MPDPELKGNEHREWYDSRAKYRYSIDEILPDGRIRMMCPQCAHDGGAQAPLGSEHAPTANSTPKARNSTAGAWWLTKWALDG